jgi:hypothetical protein
MPCRLLGGGTVIAPERAAQGSAPANGRAITDKNTEYERLKMGHLRTSATAVAVAALLASAVSPAGAAALKWDMASPYPGSNFHNQNHRMFIEEVKSRTNGAIDITLHPGASLYKLPQIRKAVQTGQIAIGEQLMATLENQAPIFGIDSLPFVANDIEKARLLAGLSANAVRVGREPRAVPLRDRMRDRPPRERRGHRPVHRLLLYDGVEVHRPAERLRKHRRQNGREAGACRPT